MSARVSNNYGTNKQTNKQTDGFKHPTHATDSVCVRNNRPIHISIPPWIVTPQLVYM